MPWSPKALILIALVTGLLSFLGCARPPGTIETSAPPPSESSPTETQRSEQPSGGVDGSGGDSIKSTEEQVRKTVDRVKGNLSVTFHRLSYFWEKNCRDRIKPGCLPSLKDDDGKSRPETIQIEHEYALLAQGLQTDESFAATIKRLQFNFTNEACHSEFEGDKAAAAKPDGQVCLSLPLLMTIPPEALDTQINALILHEIAHVRGLVQDHAKEQQLAVNLQNWFVQNQKSFLRQDYDLACDCYREKSFAAIDRLFNELHLSYYTIASSMRRLEFDAVNLCRSVAEIRSQSVLEFGKSYGLSLPAAETPFISLFSGEELSDYLFDRERKIINDICLSGSAHQKSLATWVSDESAFRKTVMEASLLRSRQLARYQQTIMDFRFAHRHLITPYIETIGKERLEMVAELPSYAFNKSWARYPKTDQDNIYCEFRNLKNGVVHAFNPRSAEWVATEKWDSQQETGNLRFFDLELADGTSRRLGVMFYRKANQILQQEKRVSAPFVNVKMQLDYKAPRYLNTRLIDENELVPLERINASMDRFTGLGVLQAGSIESFLLRFQFQQVSEGRRHPTARSEPYELRCSLGPLNQAKFTPHPLL